MVMVAMVAMAITTIFTVVVAVAIASTIVMSRASVSHWESHQSGDTGKHQKLGKPGDLLKDANFVF